MGATVALEALAATGGAVPTFRFDPETLAGLAIKLGPQFRGASPFPYIVIDDFLPEDVFESVWAELPKFVPVDDAGGDKRGAERGKTARNRPEQLGPHTTNLFYQLNAGAFLDFLEELTGIAPLISDLRLEGGGHHETVRGGRLAVHTDFGSHRMWKIRRRLNLILYMNKDWDESYNGNLELWDVKMRGCAAKVLPIANRCVVFETGAHTFHGQPDLLSCPPDRARQSLALYYYDNPGEAPVDRPTNYVARPGSVEQSRAKRLLHKAIPRKLRERIAEILV